MAQASGRYFLDGIDMFTAYGYIPSSGSDDILKIPAIKLPLSHNWADDHGTEWDLASDRKKEDDTVTLKGFLVASNEADFWTKYNALTAALFSTGTKTLQYIEFGTNRTVNVFYKSCSNLKRRTPIKNTTLIGMELDLEFQKVYTPKVTGGDVYYGYSATAPTTESAVFALPGSQSVEQTLLTIATGLNKIFTVAMPITRTLSNVFDATAQEDVTSLFIGTAMTANGQSYMVYTMQNAFAYSINHNLNVTLI